MKIIYDERELQTQSGRCRVKHIEQQATTDRLRLKSGDYIVAANIGIEVKTIDDLISSSCKGRIQGQLTEMRESYQETILIIEGQCQVNKTFEIIGTQWPWNAIWFQVLSQQRCGTMVLQTLYPEHTASVIVGLARYYEKRVHESVRRRNWLDDSPRLTPQETILTAIHGVGPDTARELFSFGGNLVTVANCSESELANCEGVGPVLSTRIHEFFRSNGNGKK